MTRYLSTAVLTLLAFAAVAAAADLESVRSFDIKPQRLETALIEFSKQSDLQVIGATDTLADTKTGGVSGKLTSREALSMLLQNTALAFNPVGSHSVQIVASKGEATSRILITDPRIRLARVETPQAKAGAETAAQQEPAEAEKGVPEILVKGKRSQNTDIQRTEDDPQPYVVFDAEDIQRSQAINLGDFLNSRLPMNTTAGTPGQNTPGEAKTVSSINLRGLGASQTLILVDGRRMPNVSEFGATNQPDINGIPMSAIERIEVLPSTAGGIYGGSATGGVINIVMRRDFRGVDTKASYTNTFDSDTATRRIDLNAGFSLEGGRTQVMVSASHSDANNLTVGDRDFADRGIALQLRNNPSEVTGYETPPLGFTTNIKSAQYDDDGEIVPLTLRAQYGGAALGSDITHLPLGYAGVASDSGAALVRNAGSYNLALSNDMYGGRRGLMAVPEMNSVSLNVRREFTDRFEAFLDASQLGNKGSSFTGSLPALIFLPSTAPTNPFNQDIYVSLPNPGYAFESRSESKTVRMSAGLIARLPHRWTGELDYNWSRSRYERRSTSSAVDSGAGTSLRTGAAVNGRPALNVLQEGNTFPIDYSPYLLTTPTDISGPTSTVLKHAALRLSGPTFDLPGGPLNLSALAEQRKENIDPTVFQNVITSTRANRYVYYTERWQQIDSLYLEARAPLISAKNAQPWIRELELQVSARRDEYQTTSNGSGGLVVPSRNGPFPVRPYFTNETGSTDYTLGLRYAPARDVALRASFSTGFVPPSILQVAPNVLVGVLNFGPDPLRGNQNTNVPGQQITYTSGGNPSLQPEESTSWSAGVIFTPRLVSGLRLSLDYTRIEKKNEIVFPDARFIMLNASLFPGRVVRGPKLVTDPASYQAGPITALDLSYLNVAKTSVDAYDIQANYDMETGRFGAFRWYAIATWEPHYEQQALPSLPVTDTVGYTSGPLEWRGNAGLVWDKGPVSVAWNAQYYNAYRIYGAFEADFNIDYFVANQGSAWIPSQTYHDLIASYRFGARSGYTSWLADSEVSIGIQNVFDKSPPILAVFDGTTPAYSTYGDPRLRRYSLSFRKNFQ